MLWHIMNCNSNTRLLLCVLLLSFCWPRFDFNLSRGMTPEEVVRVEGLVNSWVGQATAVNTKVGNLRGGVAQDFTCIH
jgi:alanyl-tRNA synthetase